MSCWTCDCGMRNCESDDCLNPRCPTLDALTFSGMVNRLHQAGAEHVSDHLHEIRKYNGCLYNREDVEHVARRLESTI